MNTDQLQEVAQLILQEAAKRGASQAEVGVAANKGFSVIGRNRDVETVEYNQDKSIDITVYFGKRTGSASLSDVRAEAVRDAVEAACHIARFTDEDPAAGLAEKDELAFHYPQLDMGSPWDISVEQAIELARQCEDEALSYDKRIKSVDEVSVATSQAWSLHANSYGFVGSMPHTAHNITCVLVAKDGDDMQRDYSYTSACDPTLLATTSHIAKEAAERTVSRLGARKLSTRKVPVMFAAEEARGLFGSFISAISGGNLYRKSSFLLDQVGKQIFSDVVHIEEQPHLAKAVGTSPFDGDGVLTRKNIFVADGVLQMYALGVYSARKLGMKTTANGGGAHNLIIRPGQKSLTELLKTMDTGLLVTELMGQGVNIVTGDYSRGASGYWVERGEIQYPVHEITIASKLPEMYRGIVEVGTDIDIRGNVRTGSVLIREMMIAGE
jgi:PmbA protein